MNITLEFHDKNIYKAKLYVLGGWIIWIAVESW